MPPDDMTARFAWATKYKSKACEWWLKTVHVDLDNHHLKIATAGAGRKLLAKRVTRGVYRKTGKSLRSSHVKPNPEMRLNAGSKGVN